MKGTPFKTNALAAALALSALLSTLPAVAAAWQDEPPQKTGAHADAEVERGRQLYLRGENARAVKTLGDAANRLKTDADAWHYYGLALNRAGKPKEAVKAFERAAKLRGSAGDRAALSLALLLSGRRGEAELEARRALELDPELPDAHFVVGMTLFAAEKFERAIEHADEALRLRPDFGAAQYLKGQAVLYIYADESDRVALKYPLRPGAEPAQRAAALGAREREFAPLVARMREAAARMEEFVNSQPNHPDAPAWRELVGTLRVYGRERRPAASPSSAAGDVGDAGEGEAATTKARMSKNPEPEYSKEAREDCISGLVRLRAVLASDGTVKHILPVKRLGYGLTQRAIEAARGIKFTPARKGGRPVSQFVLLEYNFACY